MAVKRRVDLLFNSGNLESEVIQFSGGWASYAVGGNLDGGTLELLFGLDPQSMDSMVGWGLSSSTAWWLGVPRGVYVQLRVSGAGAAAQGWAFFGVF